MMRTLTLDDPGDHARMADLLHAVLTDGNTAKDLRQRGLRRARLFAPEIALERVAEGVPFPCLNPHNAHPSCPSPSARSTIWGTGAGSSRSLRPQYRSGSGFGSAWIRSTCDPRQPPFLGRKFTPYRWPSRVATASRRACGIGSTRISRVLTASSCTACGCIRTGFFLSPAGRLMCPMFAFRMG